MTAKPLVLASGVETESGVDLEHIRSAFLKPTAALYETVDRMSGGLANFAFMVTGDESLVAISLPSGLTVTSISFMSATTAMAGGTHLHFALYDKNFALLRQSTDDTTPTWAANTLKTKALSSTFTTTYAGLHYLAIGVVATTVPTSACIASHTATLALAPPLAFIGGTGVTTTAPNPATNVTFSYAILPYGYVS